MLALLVTPVFYELLDQWANLTRRVGRGVASLPSRFRRARPPRPEPAAVGSANGHGTPYEAPAERAPLA